ncbi:MAG: ribonuclease R [Ruminococcaceae bacterium]|nr:ribonuclease R [Oscillospiraceae bacterium]
MTRYTDNESFEGGRKRSRSAMNMSAAQRRRNREIQAMAIESTSPQCIGDLEARGPLKVKNQVIGILRQHGTGGVVLPDPAFRETDFGAVVIDKNHLNGAPFEMAVVCEILNPEAGKGELRGTIKEVLGDIGNNDVRMLTVLRQFGLSPTFPEAVLKEVEPVSPSLDEETVNKEIAAGRKDLRDLLTITIDGEDAKDLDDAISLEELRNGNFRLYVHIADVSNYVREKTALDAEAYSRATSVYLVDRVIPMLPPKLSNGICSLNPKADRFTMTCEMIVDREGSTYDGKIYESVIHSDARMSYNECYRILTEPKDSDEEEYGPIVPMLSKMKVLAEILKSMRERRGALRFEFPETKVILNEDQTVKAVMPEPHNFVHGIIESFMICANEFVAKTYCSMSYSFVYRVHEDPDPIKIARFASVAKYHGAMGRLSGKIQPADIVRFMDTIGDDDALPVLDQLLLRSMAKARYSSECLGHFGLASKYYCHFTSPIRRYPDLMIHRIIKSHLHGENKRSHFGGIVEAAAEQSSEMERNAVDAERASVDIKVCEFMADKVGECYDGVVSSIIESGCFVMLDSSVEGFVPFRTLSDHYYFDEQRYRAVGARGGAVINIGQHMSVIVDNVDTELNRIDFRFADEFENTPAKKGRSSSYKSEKPSRGGRKTGDYRPSKGLSKGRPGGKPKSFGGRSGRGGKKGRR